MHTSTFTLDDGRHVSAIHNGDFSGDVIFVLRGSPDREVVIPAEVVFQFTARFIEYQRTLALEEADWQTMLGVK